MSTQDAVATYLQTLGLGTLGATLFVDWIPPTTSNVVVVTGYAGSPSIRTVGQKSAAVEVPNVQILVRDTNPSTALTAILNIKDQLDGTAGVSSAGEYLLLITTKQSDPIYLGKDDNNWTTYVQNYEILKT